MKRFLRRVGEEVVIAAAATLAGVLALGVVALAVWMAYAALRWSGWLPHLLGGE